MPLLAQLNENAKLSMLRNATWTLSNFCRGKPPPAFEQVYFEVLFLNFKTCFIWKGCEKLEWSFYFSCIYADQSCTSCTWTSYSFFWWRCFDWCVLGTIISFWWHEWQNTIRYWSGSLSKACWASTVNISLKSLLSNNHNCYNFWLIQCLCAVLATRLHLFLFLLYVLWVI